ncbi:hypothetical protein OBBRIDRAFT_844655 [Obba rivulosa]|uniref:Secreted protein n=1 Tax=Obba rivulosa TaxID=1052685 RepID=A0A8E2B063_9APHY|nr:hypothetical protein OBBRIDRAFT_844655 [Obba rivulosa]
MWGWKFSSVTVLFHLNRWLNFAWALTSVAENLGPLATFSVSEDTCAAQRDRPYSLGQIEIIALTLYKCSPLFVCTRSARDPGCYPP